MSTPYILELHHVMPRLDCAVLGAISLVSGVLNSLALTETGNGPMPETIGDLRHMFERK